jgi:curved DNA-binding protein CbpA
MSDPFELLDVPATADDAAIRARYLELVRRWSPERAPERFAAVRAAYEQVRDRDARLRRRLFDAGRTASLDSVIEAATAGARRRVTFAELLAVYRDRPS